MRTGRIPLAIVMALAGVWSASAGTLSVSPILLDVRPGSASATVTVKNMSDGPTNVEAQVMEMRQEHGAERVIPASRVAVSPPFVQLQPRQEYVFRVIRLGRDSAAAEEFYRLVIRDVPPASKGSGVSVSIGHSIPVFFSPGNAVGPKLAWSASVSKGGLVLRATNTGDKRARLTDVAVSDGRTTFPFERGSLGFVLPGSTVSWVRPLPRSFGAGPWRLTAVAEGGPIDAQIDPDR